MTEVTTIYRRRFQMTDLKSNHNKYWQVEVYSDGWLQTEWGRVGVKNEPSRKMGRIADAERMIREKERKGYVEVKLHVPTEVVVKGKKKAAVIHPRVQWLVDMIFEEAGKKQKEYLKVGIEELSQDQINDARKVLVKISELKDMSGTTGVIGELVQLFYTLIPTKLPAQINFRGVIDEFLGNMSEQEDRLNQLSAGLAGYKRRVVGQETGIESLGGVKIEWLDQHDLNATNIMHRVAMTAGYQRIQLCDIFAIEIPGERERYLQNDFGNHHEEYLYHGTNNYNLQFILGQPGGLIVPQVHSHGRYYGDGIYFANKSQKSMNYTHTATGTRTLLICKVALGDQYIQDGGCHNRTEAPKGYHSLKSKYTPSGLDELIVYRPEQSTVSYLVTYK